MFSNNDLNQGWEKAQEFSTEVLGLQELLNAYDNYSLCEIHSLVNLARRYFDKGYEAAIAKVMTEEWDLPVLKIFPVIFGLTSLRFENGLKLGHIGNSWYVKGIFPTEYWELSFSSYRRVLDNGCPLHCVSSKESDHAVTNPKDLWKNHQDFIGDDFNDFYILYETIDKDTKFIINGEAITLENALSFDKKDLIEEISLFL